METEMERERAGKREGAQRVVMGERKGFRAGPGAAAAAVAGAAAGAGAGDSAEAEARPDVDIPLTVKLFSKS